MTQREKRAAVPVRLKRNSTKEMYHWKQDTLVARKEGSCSMNVEGPFYVTEYCIICFTPPQAAPANMREHYNPDRCDSCARSSCYVAKQPENDQELDQMIEAMDLSCVRAIRYCGSDSQVLEKLCARGLRDQCDALKADSHAPSD